MARVLIIEDETMLRNSVVLGLSKLPGIETLGAGTLDEALALVDRAPPDLVLSDLDLPRRSGIELIGELGRRGLAVPVIFVSAYVRAFAAQIPRHADVEVLEKPVPLDVLRSVVKERLSRAPHRAHDSAPFGVVEYLQLSAMGRHSVEISIDPGDGLERRIVVREGELWSAVDPQGRGERAFARLAFLEGAEVSCHTLEEDPGPRDIETPMQALLLEAARLHDEGSVPREERLTTPAPTPDLEAIERAARAASLDAHLDDGLDALLRRDYEAAFAAFTEASRIEPDHPTVRANLARLEELRARAATEGEPA